MHIIMTDVSRELHQLFLCSPEIIQISLNFFTFIQEFDVIM